MFNQDKNIVKNNTQLPTQRHGLECLSQEQGGTGIFGPRALLLDLPFGNSCQRDLQVTLPN